MDKRDFLKFLTVTAVAPFASNAAANPFENYVSVCDETPCSQQYLLRQRIVDDLKQAYCSMANEYQWSINDAQTQETFKNRLTEVMLSYQQRVLEYKVVCSDTNNPPSVVDTGIVAIHVFWKGLEPDAKLWLFKVQPDPKVWTTLKT